METLWRPTNANSSRPGIRSWSAPIRDFDVPPSKVECVRDHGMPETDSAVFVNGRAPRIGSKGK